MELKSNLYDTNNKNGYSREAPNKKFYQHEKIVEMKNNIKENSNKIWLPKNNLNMKNRATDSWYNHKSYTGINNGFKRDFKNPPEIKTIRRTLKVKLILNKKQRMIIKNWLNACIVVYNKTANILTDGSYQFYNLEELYGEIRRVLINFKSEVQKKSLDLLQKIPNQENTFTTDHQVRINTLDRSIKEACKHYISNIVKFKNGQIETPNIVPLKFNNPTKILKIGKNSFSDGTFFNKALDKVKGRYKQKPNIKFFDFDQIKNMDQCVCTLTHYTETKEYYLLVPSYVDIEREREKINQNRKQVISIDPGVRTFLTGITENSVEKICSNFKDEMKPLIKKEIRYSKLDDAGKLKPNQKKRLIRLRAKISNKVDDVHWKTINYITKNHENVFIGDMNLAENNLVDPNSFTNKLLPKINIDKFRNRLEYKSKIMGVNCQVINENHTSKMCSNCGTINKDLASDKIFKCDKCEKMIDRDVNAARNIYIKSYIESKE